MQSWIVVRLRFWCPQGCYWGGYILQDWFNFINTARIPSKAPCEVYKPYHWRCINRVAIMVKWHQLVGCECSPLEMWNLGLLISATNHFLGMVRCSNRSVSILEIHYQANGAAEDMGSNVTEGAFWIGLMFPTPTTPSGVYTSCLSVTCYRLTSALIRFCQFWSRTWFSSRITSIASESCFLLGVLHFFSTVPHL